MKMQGSKQILLQLCFSLVMSVGSCNCKPLHGMGRSVAAEDFHIAEYELIERDRSNSSLKRTFGTMKEEILRKLNLSGVPQEHKIQPPLFMIELYNKYASDKSSTPRSDVIRSFIVQDVTHSERHGNKTKHRLLFNVSIPSHEDVTVAQLRLFTLWDSEQATCNEGLASVSIYDVAYGQNHSSMHPLDGKALTETKPLWQVFDVTTAIVGWLQSGRESGELEVEVKQPDCGLFSGGGCDISLSLKDNTSAVLIIFSNDLENRKREVIGEVKEMLLHEVDTVFKRAHEDASHQVSEDLHPRRKRRALGNYCRRTSLRVNFKDIGWNKWILAPPEYDAFECKGVCYFPLTDDVTPSKHAIIQALVNLSNPKKASMACCVPTKLDPITVMYKENGAITVRHLYEEMKVAECGCR